MRIIEDEDSAWEEGDQMSFWGRDKYSIENACEVCDGIVHHASWCITTNRTVFKAFEAVLYGVDEADEARLAGLGVKWNGKKK